MAGALVVNEASYFGLYEVDTNHDKFGAFTELFMMDCWSA